MDNDYLLKKWLNGDLTEAEAKEFQAREDYAEHAQILEVAAQFKASDMMEVPAYTRVKERISEATPVRKLNIRATMLRVAAVVAISLTLYFTFFAENLTEIATLAAQKTTIELPDQSEVILNASSEVAYSEKKWEQQRKIKLEGEAFFKVAKGKVFDVITPEGIVTVVGTQFNVKQRGSYFEVSCYEGIVSVDYSTSSKKLTAGESIRLINGKVYYKNVTATEPQWTQNSSYFDAVPFQEVIAELERQYNVAVEYDMSQAAQVFTGGFTHQNLDNALQSITVPLQLEYIKLSSQKIRLQQGD